MWASVKFCHLVNRDMFLSKCHHALKPIRWAPFRSFPVFQYLTVTRQVERGRPCQC